MGFAINWQQQSNTWTNLTYTPFTCLTVVPLSIPLLLLLWNETWIEIEMKKGVNNKTSIGSYIYMHADVILEHLLWTMHNGSFKSPSFSTFIHWFQIKTPHENQTKWASSGLMLTPGKYSRKIYSKLHSGL